MMIAMKPNPVPASITDTALPTNVSGVTSP